MCGAAKGRGRLGQAAKVALCSSAGNAAVPAAPALQLVPPVPRKAALRRLLPSSARPRHTLLALHSLSFLSSEQEVTAQLLFQGA